VHLPCHGTLLAFAMICARRIVTWATGISGEPPATIQWEASL
jgi:hypothetical protein